MPSVSALQYKHQPAPVSCLTKTHALCALHCTKNVFVGSRYMAYKKGILPPFSERLAIRTMAQVWRYLGALLGCGCGRYG